MTHQSNHVHAHHTSYIVRVQFIFLITRQLDEWNDYFRYERPMKRFFAHSKAELKNERSRWRYFNCSYKNVDQGRKGSKILAQHTNDDVIAVASSGKLSYIGYYFINLLTYVRIIAIPFRCNAIRTSYIYTLCRYVWSRIRLENVSSDQSVETCIANTTASFNQQLHDDPHNEELWLKFVKYQVNDAFLNSFASQSARRASCNCVDEFVFCRTKFCNTRNSIVKPITKRFSSQPIAN